MKKKLPNLIPLSKSGIKKLLLTMKLALIIVFLSVLQVSADVYSQITVNLDVQDKSIREVLKTIEQQSQVRFFYSDDLLSMNELINVKADNKNILGVLDDIFSKSLLTYKAYDNNLIVIAPRELLQQQKVTGIVVDEKNVPLPGVTVLVKGTTTGASTDINGAFTLNVPANAATLVISFVGMKTIEIPIDNQTVFNVVMNSDIFALENIVVTAFGIQRQSKSLAYAAQNVPSKALAEARNLNIVTGLSGKVAGLAITTVSTGVGAEAKVLLRGNRSISGSSQPLYVVDGITLNGGIANLSPDDIESISVLKGANAAALYGSRASNGAIIITTKSGQGASEGVTSNIGFTYMGSSAILLEKVQNIYGQGASGIYNEHARTSWGPKMEGQTVKHWSNDPNYIAKELGGVDTYAFLPQPDNIKDYFKLGNSFATNLQVNINSKKSNVAFSYTNTVASGIVETNNLKSHNLSIRVNSNLTQKLTLDSKLNLIRQNFENVFISGEDFDNPMRYLYILPRNIRTQDIQHAGFINDAGQTRQHWTRVHDSGSGNPYWTLESIEHPETIQRLISMLSLKYQITDDISILGRSAFDGTYNYTEYKRHNDTYWGLNGTYQNNNASSYEWNSDVLLNYHKKVISDITLDLNAGANNRLYEDEQVGGSGENFNIENMFALSNTQNPRPFENYSKKVVQSVYGFGEISYKNAIFLNITGRNDWSSTLPPENRSYFYPSVGLTAVLSDLITLPSIFSQVKLRGSLAEVGNDTSPYQLYRTASVSSGTIALSSTMPATNLKPEKTKSLEAGFDLRMFEDRARINFTYYKTNTYDQLFATPVPVTSGVSSVFQNGADVQNKGVEITLGASVISTKDFSWNIDVNWSKNNSKVLRIAEGFNVLSFGSDFIRDYKLVKGQPFGDIYTRGWLRNADGNVIIQANGIPAITPGMSVKVANYNPDWLGGINNSFTYKDFTFSALIDIRQGGSFISFTEAIEAGNGIIDYTTQGRDGSLLFGENIFKDETGVTATGEPNAVRVSAENFWTNIGSRGISCGEAFVRDASNIRMREMIFGYNLPKRLVSKTFFSSARVSLVGRNLFFITNKANEDPEIMDDTQNTSEGRAEFALPTNRTFGVSINFGF